MPLLKIIEIDEQTRLGLWEIEEDTDELKWALQWGQEDIKRFNSFNDRQRSMHWLASRVLLRKMLGTDKFIDLQADEYGKPVIRNFPVQVSISHSGNRVAVLLSDRPCGIDIQIMDRHLDKIAHKFIGEDEKKYVQEDLTPQQLYVYWCAKEALYKLYGKKKLDFRGDMFLQPFEDRPSGVVDGRIEKDSYVKRFKIYYQRAGNYMLAYVVGKQP